MVLKVEKEEKGEAIISREIKESSSRKIQYGKLKGLEWQHLE